MLAFCVVLSVCFSARNHLSGCVISSSTSPTFSPLPLIIGAHDYCYAVMYIIMCLMTHVTVHSSNTIYCCVLENDVIIILGGRYYTGQVTTF